MSVSYRCFILSALLLIGIQSKAQQLISPKEMMVDTVAGYSRIDTDLSYSKNNIKPGSAVKIDLSKVKFTNELSVPEFLQGRVGGLDISNISTDPRESEQVILRGRKLSRNQTPLIVIDGIPQQSLDNLFIYNASRNDIIQSMIPVPLEDIQSIEVLKDGTSTALYGADGVNGVILIETKKGEKQKLSLTYQFNQSFVNSPSYMPMLNGEEYIMYQLEAWHNTQGIFDIPAELAMDRSNPYYYNFAANTNWMEEVTQPGNAANHQLSFSGGNEKNRLYGSVNYQDKKGTTINTNNDRLLSRLNFEHYFSKKLTMALNLSNGSDNYDGNSMNILDFAFHKSPNISIWEYDAQGNRTGHYFKPYSTYQGDFPNSYNPVAGSETDRALQTTDDLMTTAHLQYKLNRWLRLRESFSYNKKTRLQKSHMFYPSSGLDTLNDISDIHTKTDLDYEQYRNEIQALVIIPFKNERIHSLNGTFTWIRKDNNYSSDTENRIGNQLRRLSGSSIDEIKNTAVSSIVYKLYNRYILMANARMESKSMYAGECFKNKFYGASLGWRFSEEPLFQSLKLNDGLLHAGCSLMEYRPDAGFSLFSNPISWDPFNNSNEINPIFTAFNNIYTPSYDAGLELELLENRLHFSADYYYRKPEIRSWSGMDPMLAMKSNGWEAALYYSIIERKELSWSVLFNIAHDNQAITKVMKEISYGPSISGSGHYGTYLAEGQSLGAIYGLQREGVYASNEDAFARDREGNIYYENGEPLKMMFRHSYFFSGGDTKYKDQNYDGTIDEADLVYLGNTTPTYIGGFGSTVRFKNLTLTCNFHYRTGNKIINQTAMDDEGLYSTSNMSKRMLNRWRVQGEQGPDLMPRAYLNSLANYLPSDRYVESGSFARLDYLNLGYAFGSAFCQKIHVKDLSLDLSGQRLYTFTSYSGLNPETQSSNDRISKDYSRVSPPKVFTLSIRVTI